MHQGRNDTRGADVVILTAIPLEYNAVRQHVDDLIEVEHPRGTSIYEVGSFETAHGKRNIAMAQIGAGTAIAGIAIERAVSLFNPTVVLFVGVAGGLKDVVRGDVVAANWVYGYEAVKEDGSLGSRIKSHHSDGRLVERAKAVARGTSWHRRIGQETDPLPNAYVGPIAAGDKIVSSETSSTFQRLREHCNDALAVEMEGWGFLEGAYKSPGVRAIVIRGISDLVKEGKPPNADLVYQPIAARHAAAFCFELLGQLPQRLFDRRADGLASNDGEMFTWGGEGPQAHNSSSELVSVHPSMYATYSNAIRVIQAAMDDGDPHVDRSISIVSLHGLSGNRLAAASEVGEPILGQFDALLQRCLMAPPPDSWHVRVVYNVLTVDRLDMVVSYLKKWREAHRWEVRAFRLPEPIPLLAPLIVNGYDLLFGLEHARFFRAGQSIHIRGRAAAAIAESYFDQLWYDPRVFRLRSLSGNNTEEVARLASSFGAEVDLTRI